MEKKKTISDLRIEIATEAEESIMDAIIRKRAKICYITLVGFMAIIISYFFFAEPHALDGIFTGKVKFHNLLLLILLTLFVITILTDLPIRVSSFIKIRKTDKFINKVRIEYQNLVNSRLEGHPADIKNLEESIDSTKRLIKEYQKQFEEDIQSYEQDIESYEHEIKLLKEIGVYSPSDTNQNPAQ